MSYSLLPQRTRNILAGFAISTVLATTSPAGATPNSNLTPFAMRLYRAAKDQYEKCKRPLAETPKWRAMADLEIEAGLNKKGRQSDLWNIGFTKWCAEQQAKSAPQPVRTFNVKLSQIRYYLRVQESAGNDKYLDKLYRVVCNPDIKKLPRPANQP